MGNECCEMALKHLYGEHNNKLIFLQAVSEGKAYVSEYTALMSPNLGRNGHNSRLQFSSNVSIL